MSDTRIDSTFITGDVAYEDHRLRDVSIFLILLFSTLISYYAFSKGNLPSTPYLVFLLITNIFGIVSLSRHVIHFVSTWNTINNAVDYVRKKPDGVYVVGFFTPNFELYQVGDKQATKETVKFTKVNPKEV